MAFQLANLDKPNSKTNTVVFCMFNAKDSWSNLHTALEQYREQDTQLLDLAVSIGAGRGRGCEPPNSRANKSCPSTFSFKFIYCFKFTETRNKWYFFMGTMSSCAKFMGSQELQVGTCQNKFLIAEKENKTH